MSSLRLSLLIPLALVASAATAGPIASHVSASCSLSDTAPPPREEDKLDALTVHPGLYAPAPIALAGGTQRIPSLRPGGALLHYVWVETTNVPSFGLLPPEIAIAPSARFALHTF